MSTYYEILGVAQTATDKEIKKAYRELCREWHPDMHRTLKKALAEELFKKINEAYEVLKDPIKRRQYDSSFSHASYDPPPTPKSDTEPNKNQSDDSPKKTKTSNTYDKLLSFLIPAITYLVLVGSCYWMTLAPSKSSSDSQKRYNKYTTTSTSGSIPKSTSIEPIKSASSSNMTESVPVIPRSASTSDLIPADPSVKTVQVVNANESATLSSNGYNPASTCCAWSNANTTSQINTPSNTNESTLTIPSTVPQVPTVVVPGPATTFHPSATSNKPVSHQVHEGKNYNGTVVITQCFSNQAIGYDTHTHKQIVVMLSFAGVRLGLGGIYHFKGSRILGVATNGAIIISLGSGVATANNINNYPSQQLNQQMINAGQQAVQQLSGAIINGLLNGIHR